MSDRHPLLVEADRRRWARVEEMLAGERADIGPPDSLGALLDTAMTAPKILAVKLADISDGEMMACELKPDADYIVIERSMAAELVLRAIERDRARATIDGLFARLEEG